MSEPSNAEGFAFPEIRPAVEIFEILEMAAFRVGDGRPPGSRNELWGSVVVLSRAAIEGAFHPMHRSVCQSAKCEFTKMPLTRSSFETFIRSHDRKPLLSGLDPALHVWLRKKASSNTGSGSGAWVDGPRDGDGVLQLLDGFNHIRNGFAHLDPGKRSCIPPKGEGLFWLRSGESWSVQKPHALSAIRFAHILHRFLALNLFGDDVALDSRAELPRMADERLSDSAVGEPSDLLEELSEAVALDELQDAIELTERLRLSIAKASMDVVGAAEAPRLFDPVRQGQGNVGPGQQSLPLQD